MRGLSIGFRPLEDPTPIKGTGGLRWGSWEMLELSAVTVPANQDCSITLIKSLDQAHMLAASGDRQRPIVRPQTIKELELEFRDSTTMTPAIFGEKRAAIIKRDAEAQRATPAPAPVVATFDDLPISRKFFKMVLAPVVKAIGRTMKEENDKKLNDPRQSRGFIG